MICTIEATRPEAKIDFSTTKHINVITNIAYPVSDADLKFTAKVPSGLERVVSLQADYFMTLITARASEMINDNDEIDNASSVLFEIILAAIDSSFICTAIFSIRAACSSSFSSRRRILLSSCSNVTF